MKVVAFVPIKLNNERLPNKNIKPFTNGKPLITYILSTLLNVKNIDETYVYCSDDSITKYLPEGIKFLKRDKYLDLSTTPFNEVLKSFAKQVSADIYVLTHATAPFISSHTIEEGVSAVLNGRGDSALTVQRLQEFLWADGTPINYDPVNIPRTQDLKPFYKETCGLYVYGRNLILEENRRVGDKPVLIEVSEIEAVDINTPNDFILAESMLKMLEGGGGKM